MDLIWGPWAESATDASPQPSPADARGPTFGQLDVAPHHPSAARARPRSASTITSAGSGSPSSHSRTSTFLSTMAPSPFAADLAPATRFPQLPHSADASRPPRIPRSHALQSLSSVLNDPDDDDDTAPADEAIEHRPEVYDAAAALPVFKAYLRNLGSLAGSFRRAQLEQQRARTQRRARAAAAASIAAATAEAIAAAGLAAPALYHGPALANSNANAAVARATAAASSSSSSSSSPSSVSPAVSRVAVDAQLDDCLRTVPRPFFFSSYALSQQPFLADLDAAPRAPALLPTEVLHSIGIPTTESILAGTAVDPQSSVTYGGLNNRSSSSTAPRPAPSALSSQRGALDHGHSPSGYGGSNNDDDGGGGTGAGATAATSAELIRARSAVGGSTSPDAAGAAAVAALQEELTTYADKVEAALQTQVAAKAPFFFQSLHTLEALHDDVSACLAEISLIRGAVAQVGGGAVGPPLATLAAARAGDNAARAETAALVLRRALALASVLETQVVAAAGDAVARAAPGTPAAAAAAAAAAATAPLPRPSADALAKTELLPAATRVSLLHAFLQLSDGPLWGLAALAPVRARVLGPVVDSLVALSVAAVVAVATGADPLSAFLPSNNANNNNNNKNNNNSNITSDSTRHGEQKQDDSESSSANGTAKSKTEVNDADREDQEEDEDPVAAAGGLTRAEARTARAHLRILLSLGGLTALASPLKDALGDAVKLTLARAVSELLAVVEPADTAAADASNNSALLVHTTEAGTTPLTQSAPPTPHNNATAGSPGPTSTMSTTSTAVGTPVQSATDTNADTASASVANPAANDGGPRPLAARLAALSHARFMLFFVPLCGTLTALLTRTHALALLVAGVAAEAAAPTALRAAFDAALTGPTGTGVTVVDVARGRLRPWYPAVTHATPAATTADDAHGHGLDACESAGAVEAEEGVTVVVHLAAVARAMDPVPAEPYPVMSSANNAHAVNNHTNSKQLQQQQQQQKSPEPSPTNAAAAAATAAANAVLAPPRLQPVRWGPPADRCCTAAAASSAALSAELTGSLYQLAEFLQARVGRMLSARAAAHASLTLEELRQVVDKALDLVADAEQLCGRAFYGLRATLLDQAKAFLAAASARAMSELSAALDAELWAPVPAPESVQRALDCAYTPNLAPGPEEEVDEAVTAALAATAEANAAASAAAAAAASTAAAAAADGGGENATAPATAATATTATPMLYVVMPASAVAGFGPTSTSPLPSSSNRSFSNAFSGVSGVGGSIGSASGNELVRGGFPAVKAVFVLVDALREHVECATEVPAVAAAAVQKAAELIKLFNTRSCQLVLGAQCMQTVGVKAVTATHLALAAQAVGFALSQLPVLRRALARRLSGKQAVLLQALDALGRDLDYHRAEVFSKLANMVGSICEAACQKLLVTDWARAAAAAPSLAAAVTAEAAVSAAAAADNNTESKDKDQNEAGKPDQCIRMLLRQTAALHKALSELLNPSHRDAIFREIASLFTGICFKYLTRLDMGHPVVQERTHANVAYLLDRLLYVTKIPGLCKELRVFVHTAPAAASSSSSSASTSASAAPAAE